MTILFGTIGFVLVFVLLIGTTRLSAGAGRGNASGRRDEKHLKTCGLAVGCGSCSCGEAPLGDGETPLRK
jgi:hypothetical protein